MSSHQVMVQGSLDCWTKIEATRSSRTFAGRAPSDQERSCVFDTGGFVQPTRQIAETLPKPGSF